MRAQEQVETRKEFEDRLERQSDEADAGAYDHVFAEMIDDLVNQLPEGYVFENSRIVRLDPSLPDHVYVTSKVNGLPSGQVRIPAL